MNQTMRQIKEQQGSAGEALLIQYWELIINRELEISLGNQREDGNQKTLNSPPTAWQNAKAVRSQAPRACRMHSVNN